MATYKVTWEIEVDASSPHDAARTALEIMLDKDSTATVFTVGTTIDLAELPVTASDNGLFKRLSPETEAQYRKWARDNYQPFEPISGVWHPATQDECVKINIETGYDPEPSKGGA